MRKTLVVLTAISGLWVGALMAAGPAPFNTERATASLREAVISGYRLTICSGEVKVAHPMAPSDWANRIISPESYQWLRAAEKAGLVTIVVTEDYESFMRGENGSFSKMREVGKIQLKISVTFTPDGEKLAASTDKGYEGCRTAPMISKHSVKLISQERKSDGINQFVLVMASYTFEPTEIYKQMSTIKPPIENEGKMAAVWKWDPFKNEWLLAAGTWALMSQDLDMTNIRKALGDAR